MHSIKRSFKRRNLYWHQKCDPLTAGQLKESMKLLTKQHSFPTQLNSITEAYMGQEKDYH